MRNIQFMFLSRVTVAVAVSSNYFHPFTTILASLGFKCWFFMFSCAWLSVWLPQPSK